MTSFKYLLAGVIEISEMRGVIDRDADESAFPASYASL